MCYQMLVYQRLSNGGLVASATKLDEVGALWLVTTHRIGD
ncbi:hypothetical protein Nizo1839_2542 [Lactiplantibacillus plantarum]|nr:hypothetical protein SF2A35B_2615 [Lactiplantibacillus plantarum]KZT78480.1 hypothetical protein Nizo1839_2542 [Lactiplantibacillus plantarum]